MLTALVSTRVVLISAAMRVSSSGSQGEVAGPTRPVCTRTTEGQSLHDQTGRAWEGPSRIEPLLVGSGLVWRVRNTGSVQHPCQCAVIMASEMAVLTVLCCWQAWTRGSSNGVVQEGEKKDGDQILCKRVIMIEHSISSSSFNTHPIKFDQVSGQLTGACPAGKRV